MAPAQGGLHEGSGGAPRAILDGVHDPALDVEALLRGGKSDSEAASVRHAGQREGLDQDVAQGHLQCVGRGKVSWARLVQQGPTRKGLRSKAERVGEQWRRAHLDEESANVQVLIKGRAPRGGPQGHQSGTCTYSLAPAESRGRGTHGGWNKAINRGAGREPRAANASKYRTERGGSVG